ncbi:MAG: hypothetical protein AB1646_07145 [Thermodesulfobacteriota bacterium]
MSESALRTAGEGTSATRFAVFFLVVSVGFACVMAGANTGLNSDLFLGIAAGRQTWEGYPVGPDRWSFTATGGLWTDQAWLSHLLLYLSYEALGDLGPVIWKVLLLLGCVALVSVRCSRIGATPGASLLAGYVGVMASAPFLTIRAENFGVFLFVWFGLLLWDAERPPSVSHVNANSGGRGVLQNAPSPGILPFGKRPGVSSTHRAIRVAAIPAVMTLWGNCHGSFMFGMGLLGFRVILEWAAYIGNRLRVTGSPGPEAVQAAHPDRGELRTCIEWSLVFLGTLVLLATLTPFGLRNILMPFIQVGAGLVTANSADWLPLWSPEHMVRPLGSGSVFPYLVFLGLLTVSCVWLAGSRLAGKASISCPPGEFEPLRHRAPTTAESLTLPLPLPSREGNGKPSPLAGKRKERGAQSTSGISRISRRVTMGRDDPAMSAFRPACRWKPLAVEVAAVVGIIVLSCRFRRMILFAGFTCVPLAALLLSLCAQDIRDFFRGRRVRIIGGMTAATLLLCVSTGWACYRFSMVPYLPDNPLRPSRPLVRDLMSYDTFSPHLIRFIRENRITGNAVVGWELSTFVLCRAPGIRVFMDTRDQSLYPPEIIRDYFAVMGVREGSESQRLALLDRYRADLAILSTDPYDFGLAMMLLRSKKWGCLYGDDYSMVLARTDSARFGEMLKTVNLTSLRFPDTETRTRTEALQSQYAYGKVRPELVSKLRHMVLTRPWPNYYVLICWGMDDPPRCFQPATRDFLQQEGARLSKISPWYRHGAEEITVSLGKIYGILAANAATCGNRPESLRFGALRDAVEGQYEALVKYYAGSQK